MRLVYEEKLLLKFMRGGTLLKEDDKKEKILTQLEIDNIIDNSINISILSKLFNLKLLNEKEFLILREKIKSFY